MEAKRDRELREAQAAKSAVARTSARGRAELARMAESERRKRRQDIEHIRSIDRAAADAAVQVDRWREIVAAAERAGDKVELARARKFYRDRRCRWTVLAATHPRLRDLVKPGDLEEFRADLELPLSRARADMTAARERLQNLRDAGQWVSTAALAEAELTVEVSRARWELEMDNARHGDADRRRKLRESKGIKTPPTDDEKYRLKRRRELEQFLTTATQQVIASGMHPEAAKRLRGEPS